MSTTPIADFSAAANLLLDRCEAAILILRNSGGQTGTLSAADQASIASIASRTSVIASELETLAGTVNPGPVLAPGSVPIRSAPTPTATVNSGQYPVTNPVQTGAQYPTQNPAQFVNPASGLTSAPTSEQSAAIASQQNAIRAAR